MTRAALRQMWDHLRAGYWFLPGLAALLTFFLAQLMYELDSRIANDLLETSRFIYSTTSEGGRTVMVGLAGTILGTAGVVFSLLTVPISVAASQFGSRLLRIYIRDEVIQFVLAIFVGTFVYCLALALALPVGEGTEGPQLATTVGLLLGLVSFGSLLALVHRVAFTLQAPNLVARASDELANVIRTSNEHMTAHTHLANDASAADELLAAQMEQEGFPIYATREGYIQDIDAELALHFATRHDLVVRLIRKPGHFVEADQLVAIVVPAGRVNKRVAANLANAYRLGDSRTPTQDIEYGINQLVEMAVRAMSRAINDPFTAITCLDHLGARLAAVAAHRPTVFRIYDANGRLRLLTDAYSFSELLDAAFNMLRRSARDNADVLLAILDAIEVIGRKANSPHYRAELLRHVCLVDAESEAGTSVAWDKERVGRRCAELSRVFGEP
jgi:uncharacterized membrane protein